MPRFFSAIALFACVVSSKERVSITVAVASNVQFAMENIREEFTKRTGVEVQMVFGASGKLATQIRNGAPYDVFVSADMSFPDSLYRWGLASHKPVPYAYGKLVLWTLHDLDLERGIEVLRDVRINRIAISDPEKAPYGRGSMQVLERTGMRQSLASKLVYGENVGQVGHYILNLNAEIGFTSKSLVLAPHLKGKGKWVEVDSIHYDRIAQGAVICKHGQKENPEASVRFLRFLHSSSASRRIFSQWGYDLR